MTSQVLDATQISFLTRFLGLRLASADGDDLGLSETIEGYLSTLPDDIRALSGSDPDLAQRLTDDVAAARGLRDAGDLAGALIGLEGCTRALAGTHGVARAGEAAAEIPEGLVRARVRAIELALLEWQVGRLQAIEELGDLVAALTQESDPDLVEIGVTIAALGRDIPNALEKALGTLRGAVGSDDDGRIAAAKDGAAKALADAGRYLKDNADDLKKCEVNPYGIAINAVGAVSAAISAVEQSLERI